MKVCILTTAFPRWAGDDRGIFVFNAARALTKKGFQVRVIAIHSPGAKNREMMDGVEVIRPAYLPARFEILQKEGGGLPIVWKKYPLARLAILPFILVQTIAAARYGRDCDILHANWTLSGTIAWASRWLHRRPYVVTVQGSDLYQTRSMKWARTFSRIGLNGAKKVISLSHDLAKQVTSLGIPREKQCVIPNGINVDDFHPGSEERENNILFVGSLIPRKGPAYLLHAMPEILQRFPDAQLFMVGEGALESELKQLTRSLKIEDQVHLLGRQTQEEVSNLMRRAKVFVLPSLEEGLGVVLLEAIASGTPCVGSSVGGIPDVVVPSVGTLVPPENPQALAEAITAILADPQKWGAMSQAARQRAQEVFNWDRVADRIIEVYQEALGRQVEQP